MDTHEILTIEEVAEYLRVSERTVYDWANKGRIPCGKLGTSWRFKRSEVERWVNEKLSGNGQTATAGPVSVADALSPERILLGDFQSKADVLEALVERLAATEFVQDPEAFRREIMSREELMSTGIGFQVAVPHVRIPSVTGLVMAVAISSNDLPDYASLDDAPIRIVCMVGAREDQHVQYLQTLQSISRALRDEATRQSLLDTTETRAAFLLLTQT
jgi:PTS system nitrogen regulatory IIA component